MFSIVKLLFPQALRAGVPCKIQGEGQDAGQDEGQDGKGRSLTVLSSIFVVLRLYRENLRAEFAQPFATLPYVCSVKAGRGIRLNPFLPARFAMPGQPASGIRYA